MLQRLASIVALDLALCCACGAERPNAAGDDRESDAAVADRMDDFTAATALKARSLGPSSTTASSGAELWLRRYDAVTISGVATDSRGNLVLARSGAETLALGAGGEQRWSVPYGSHVAIDGDDNVYVAGRRDGSGTFVAKLSPDGERIYEATLGAEASGEVESIAVDGAQNVAISGAGLGTSKLDAAGGLLWQKPWSGQLAFDSRGELWLAGTLEGERAFGATTLASEGGSDVLLLELDANGAPVTARRFGDSAALQRAEAIAVDADDNVLLGGTCDGTLDFGAGVLEHRPRSCTSDAWCVTSGFLAKLDHDGGARFSVSLGLARAVPGLAAGAGGDIAVSSVLPGGVRPFRQPRVSLLGPDAERLWQRSDYPATGIGGGHAVTFDANGDVIWSVSARPSLELEEESYLAKLAH